MGLIKKVGTKALAATPPTEPAPPDQQTPPAAPDGGDTRRGLTPPAPPDGGDTRRGLTPPAAHEGDDTDEEEEARRIAALNVLPSGTILQSRYQITEPIGVGGMSVVYRGRDLRFKDVVRYCAIKEMAQSAPDSNTRLLNLKNFEREAGLLATLQHPAIPKVYDFFVQFLQLPLWQFFLNP